jgi:alkylated DNA repair dioxygenase AlkB
MNTSGMNTFEQMSLFSPTVAEQERGQQSFNLPDGDVTLYEGFLGAEQSDRILRTLTHETPWRQDHIQIAGKTIPLPRLTAWYGDPGKGYAYSGIAMQAEPWTATLLDIKTRVEAKTGVPFNSVLLNYYRTGQDSVAWHSDDEPELGHHPVIASVSVGATRRFHLKHKTNKALNRVAIDLTHGSLLLMQGATQHGWQHQVPKTARPVGPRINLTFRAIA